MDKIELEEEDVIRIIDTEDLRFYIFNFSGDRDNIYKMYDSEYEGEECEDHESYTDSHSEIAFTYSPCDDPKWPVIVEINEDE